MARNKIEFGGNTMSLNKSATIRRALLGASSLVLAAFALTSQASAQATFTEKPQVGFPAGGNFANLTPSAGNDTVTVAPETALYLPIRGNFSGPTEAQESVTKNFLTGTNVITNNGYVFVGMEEGQVLVEGNRSSTATFLRDHTRYEAYMRMENLTTFNNNGSIYMGAFYEGNTSNGAGLVGTDRWTDDILSMPGAEFIGGTNSKIFLDVNLNAVGQTACNQAQRITDPVAGDTGSRSLPVADCLDLSGGAASGRTALIIHDIFVGDRGAYNPEGSVIIDMTGADPADVNPNAFFVGGSANAAGYDARNGGGLDKGMFLYTLGYDSTTQQFKLYGVESAGSRQFPLLSHAASDLWRSASGGWFERQVDQRALDDDDGRGGGFWGRVVTSRTDRGVTDMGQAGDKALVFDNSYEQEDTAVTFGVDLVSADGGGGWTAGAMIGYARSRIDFNDYDNEANLEGMHAGLYGGFTAGEFFVDAALNGTWIDIDVEVPAMDLLPAGTLLATKGGSLGGRLEAGWRLRADRFSLEPLAGLTYVSTSFDAMDVPADDPARFGGEVAFDDATSMRASVGVRFSLDDFVPLTPTTRLSLTARHGSEFDGEAAATIANVGPTDAAVANTFDGAFSELTATFTATSASEAVAGYLNFGALFGDDYDNIALSGGLRFQW